jgi:hypothetical protein
MEPVVGTKVQNQNTFFTVSLLPSSSVVLVPAEAGKKPEEAIAQVL